MPFSVRMTPDFAPIPMQLPSECPIHLMSECPIHLVSEYPIHLVSECPIHSMSESSIHLPSTYPIHLKRELSAVQKVKNRYLGKLTPCYFTTFHHTFPKVKTSGRHGILQHTDKRNGCDNLIYYREKSRKFPPFFFSPSFFICNFAYGIAALGIRWHLCLANSQS